MKINVPGKTPMERLTNLTRGVIAVRKADVDVAEKRRQPKKRRRRA